MRKIILLLTTFFVVNVFAIKTITLSENNSVFMNEEFTMESVSKVSSELLTLSKKTDSDIYLVMYSPGGSIIAGQRFIDTVKSLPNKIHTITLFSASMAYHTVQSLNTRYITKSGILMSHRASLGGLSGQLPGEINTRLNFFTDMVNNMEKSASKRINIPLTKYKKIIRDELWLQGHDAVKLNHADSVVNVRCDKNLNKVVYRIYNAFGNQYKVGFSKCPLILGPVSVKAINTFSDSEIPSEKVKKYFINKFNYKLQVKSRL